ncbi:MAG: hypothetical protein KGL53_08775 [Elusimicrobia bacterium]|nr:hypothetical protein [Elusimicrobiota bacterium]
MRRMLFAASGLALVLLLGAALAAWCRAAESSRLAAAIKEQVPVPLPAARAEGVRERAVAYARSMGAPYDPLMGEYGDPFGRLGFVVCVDVPIRSYMSAGVSLPGLLRAAAHEHPEWFRIGPGNAPSNRFFYRRVRNYVDLFRRDPALEASETPRPGDLAFFGRWHVALVTHGGLDGTWKAVEASGPSVFVREWDGDVLTERWGAPAFFGRLRAGRPPTSLPAPRRRGAPEPRR